MGLMSPFGELIAPIETAQFLAENWQRAPKLIRGSDPQRFAALLPLVQLDELLTERRLAPNRIRMAKGGATTIESSAYTRGDGSFDPARGIAAYLDGGTVILNHLHTDTAPIAAFCRAISDELATELQCNAYVTPAGSQGFPVHYDTHDVFIAQAHGRKHWKIYDSPIKLPLAGQPHDQSGTTPGDLTLSVELEQGDLLYIPRGFYHEAIALDGMSVHLTLGLMSKTWSDLLLEAVSFAALELPQLREAPRPRFGLSQESQDEDRSALLARLIEVHAFVSEKPLGVVLRPAILYPNERPQRGEFLEALKIATLNLSSTLQLRTDRKVSLEVVGDQLDVVSDDCTIQFPNRAGEALSHLLNGHPVIVAKLCANLDDKAKLLLARKLLENRLVRQIESGLDG
jgi:ribosomal protein L16 Arg81 hydroxylase